MADYWSTKNAVEGLADGLREMERLTKERERYPYEPPYAWTTDAERATRNVRDAVRFLCSPEADD